MPRRKFGHEFEVEAVQLIQERWVSVTQSIVPKGGFRLSEKDDAEPKK